MYDFRYLPDSLKSQTREKRGKGVRRRVTEETPVPGNWPSFHRSSDNKRELFDFLADRTITMTTEKLVVSTKGVAVTSNRQMEVELASIQPCSHEEADTRMILHLSSSAYKYNTAMTIRTVDTDVVVLAVAYVGGLAV